MNPVSTNELRKQIINEIESDSYYKSPLPRYVLADILAEAFDYDLNDDASIGEARWRIVQQLDDHDREPYDCCLPFRNSELHEIRDSL